MKKIIFFIALFYSIVFYPQDYDGRYYHVPEVRNIEQFFEHEEEIFPETIYPKFEEEAKDQTRDRYNHVKKEVVKNGNMVTVKSFANGKLFHRATYKKGLLEGNWILYHLNGGEMFVIPFVKGKANGVGKVYDTKANLIAETTYRDNKRHGLRRIYSPYREQIIEGNFENDKFIGKIKVTDSRDRIYYFDGDYNKGTLTIYEGNIKGVEIPYIEENIKHGQVIEYYNTGTKRSVSNYYLNMRHGSFEYYRMDGTLHFKNEYLFGKPVGQYKYLSPNDVVLQEAYYDNEGRKTGHWIYREQNGQIEKEEDYSNDKLNGLVKKYTKGMIHSEVSYVDGKREGMMRSYDYKTGRLTEETMYKDNQRQYILSYYINGKVFRKETLKNDKLVLTQIYDSKGNLDYESRYNDKGLPVGIHKMFYIKNDYEYYVSMETHYNDAGLRVKTVQYHSVPGGYSSISYKGDIKHGPTEIFSPTTNKKDIRYYFEGKEVTEEEFKKLSASKASVK